MSQDERDGQMKMEVICDGIDADHAKILTARNWDREKNTQMTVVRLMVSQALFTKPCTKHSLSLTFCWASSE